MKRKTTKLAELPGFIECTPAVDVSPPPMPTEPCWMCQESGYHLNQARNAWLCDRCHPIVLQVEAKGETE